MEMTESEVIQGIELSEHLSKVTHVASPPLTSVLSASSVIAPVETKEPESVIKFQHAAKKTKEEVFEPEKIAETSESLSESSTQEESKNIVEVIKGKLDDHNMGGSVLTALHLRKTKGGRNLNVVYEIPYVNAHYASKFFCVMGFLYIAISVVLFVLSSELGYIMVDYTHIKAIDENVNCSERVKEKNIDNTTDCIGAVTFVMNNMTGPAYVYYALDPFFQSTRHLVDAVDASQLLGNPIETRKSACDVLTRIDGAEIVPCGTLANAMFNDTFQLERLIALEPLKERWIVIPFKRTNITTIAEQRSFRNPENWTVAFANASKPPYWRKRIEDIAETDEEKTGFENEAFIVWMNVAPLPYVVKIYAQIDPEFEGGSLFEGRYKLTVYYNYPLWHPSARKYFIVANTDFFGHKNYTLASYFIGVGLFSLIVSIFLLVAHLKYDLPTVKRLHSLGVKTKVNAGFTCRRKV